MCPKVNFLDFLLLTAALHVIAQAVYKHELKCIASFTFTAKVAF